MSDIKDMTTQEILEELRIEHRKLARGIALRDEMLWSAMRIIHTAHNTPEDILTPGFVLGCMMWLDQYDEITSEAHVD